jgi:predicted enzyme related to lactoylglutathione lyase
MTFEIKNFATIRLCSSDLQKSKQWYQKFLGHEPVEDLENFVSFKICGVCLDISEADEKSPSSLGGAVGYWLVNDLDAAIEKAVDLGGIVYRGPLRVEEVRRTIVQIKDPIGNVIGLEADFK